MWRLFADAEAFRTITQAMAAPWKGENVTHVCGIESRGFLVGGAVTLHLRAGFVAVRKSEGLFPGPKFECETSPDYRGIEHRLRIQRDALQPGDRVLLVDDWAERGSQAAAVRELVERCGATFLGCALIIDQLDDTMRARLGRVDAIASASELGPSASTPQ